MPPPFCLTAAEGTAAEALMLLGIRAPSPPVWESKQFTCLADQKAFLAARRVEYAAKYAAKHAASQMKLEKKAARGKKPSYYKRNMSTPKQKKSKTPTKPKKPIRERCLRPITCSRQAAESLFPISSPSTGMSGNNPMTKQPSRLSLSRNAKKRTISQGSNSAIVCPKRQRLNEEVSNDTSNVVRYSTFNALTILI